MTRKSERESGAEKVCNIGRHRQGTWDLGQSGEIEGIERKERRGKTRRETQ